MRVDWVFEHRRNGGGSGGAGCPSGTGTTNARRFLDSWSMSPNSDDPLSLPERQVAALLAQEDPAGFLVSAESMLRALGAEPRIAVHLDDIRDEAIDRVRVLEVTDSEL